MDAITITTAQIHRYLDQLSMEEKSFATLKKYRHDLLFFLSFTAKHAVDKALILKYKEQLQGKYAVTSANSMLAAINSFFRFLGHGELCVKLFKVQRSAFRNKEKELTRREYERLVRVAGARRNERLALLMQTICSTGIRVSEHSFITAEALDSGQALVPNKGKTRTVFLPGPLCKSLKAYCKRHGISHGPVFVTSSGKPLDRTNIWVMMKALCKAANVDRQKVFPHNLRHLFAQTYYQVEKDIVHLADILGHASVETTRIYTLASGMEQARKIARLRLLI